MTTRKLAAQLRMASLVVLVAATIAFLPPVAQAQVYLYGRADFLTGGNPASAVSADFNGDGRPDLAVAVSNFQGNQVSILLASPQGGFVSSGNFATGASPIALFAGDFNRDKKLDLAVVNSEGTISILLGNGDGTFQGQVDYPIGQNPVGLVGADFDGDGNLDLATLSTADSAITVLLGKGDGTFAVQALIPVTSGPTALTGGDANGDGKIDLITTNSSFDNPTITVLLNQGDGTFTQVNSQAPFFASALAVGDFNRDGKLDALIVAESTVFLALGNGDGSFQNAVSIPNAPNVFAQGILVGDFNHDHKLDVALPGLFILLGKGDGTFQNPTVSPVLAGPLTLLDVNGDGQQDILTAASSGEIGVLLGNGDGTFMDLHNVALATSSFSPNAGVAADFNGDGKLDLAVAEQNFPNGQVSVELGKGNGSFGKPIVSTFTTSATSTSLMLAADFTGDGKIDLLVLDSSNSGFQVLPGRGNGSFATPVDNPFNFQVDAMVSGDFNKDGKADLAVTTDNNGSPSMNIYLSKGDGTFSPGLQYVVYPNSRMSVADVNGDGNLDIVVASAGFGNSSNLLVFIGNGDGTFKNPILGPNDRYTSQPAIADFNHDGKLDIAVGTGNGTAFLAGNGDGTFAPQVYSNTGIQFQGSLIASDFNGDHKLDLLNTFNFPQAQIMSGNGDGTFGAPIEYDSGNGSGFGAIAGDFNSDGVSDLGIPVQLPPTNAPVVLLYLSTPTPNLSPTSLNFGPETVGKTSAPKKVNLTNAGNARLKISSITVTGDFLERNNCGKGLAIGKSCTIQVSFKPQAKGIRTGLVSIMDNAPGHTQTVSLKGTGK